MNGQQEEMEECRSFEAEIVPKDNKSHLII